MKKSVAIIGLGAIGAPIAHRLYQNDKERFYIIANGTRRKQLETVPMIINGRRFVPNVISSAQEAKAEIDILLVCVKNYDLEVATADIQKVITKKTVILPLQNGLYAHAFLKKAFKQNIVLQGYVQGPNTEICGKEFWYQHAGDLHIGSDEFTDVAQDMYRYLCEANIQVSFENDIKYMVWKKLMLNVAGNSITALTGANYSEFKLYNDIQLVCRAAMNEFVMVAKAEGVALADKDIDEIIKYYITYEGNKKTSMLVDVENKRRTENAYLAGAIVCLAQEHSIDIPIIMTLYCLLEVKEHVYTAVKNK